MIIGILGILLAVAFWFLVGVVLRRFVTDVLAPRREPPWMPPVWTPHSNRQILYEDVLGAEEDNDGLANHWSTGPYGRETP